LDDSDKPWCRFLSVLIVDGDLGSRVSAPSRVIANTRGPPYCAFWMTYASPWQTFASVATTSSGGTVYSVHIASSGEKDEPLRSYPVINLLCPQADKTEHLITPKRRLSVAKVK